MIRSGVSAAATAVLVASTALTWWGVAAVVVLAALFIDMQRRVRHVLADIDSVNAKLDQQQATIEELKAIVTGDEG